MATEQAPAQAPSPDRRAAPGLGEQRTELRGRRRHVWGPIPGSQDGSEPPAKRKRKSRWADADEPKQAVPAAASDGTAGKELVVFPEKVLLPPILTGRSPTGDPEVLELHRELAELDRKLRLNLIDIPPDGERSPSPPPVYDALGIRQNTREVRYRDKMIKRRNKVIESLISKDITYRPPGDYRPEKKTKKIFIPLKDYPGYNFIGLIIGPRGNTQKRMQARRRETSRGGLLHRSGACCAGEARAGGAWYFSRPGTRPWALEPSRVCIKLWRILPSMQAETNTKIAIRGRGSVKEGAARDPKYDYGEDEELHVLITGDRQEEVDAAVAMIERLLQPMDEEMNEHKKLQLRELAALNGTLKDDTYCFLCGDSGHHQSECPQRASKVEELYARDVARMNPGEAGKMDQEYKSFLAELGGGPLPPEPVNPLGAPRSRPGDESDATRLYIGNLAPTVSDALLRELFEPYGTVLQASVPTDPVTGAPRGFGFVHFSDEATAAAAREANGRMVEGRPIIVRLKGEERGAPLGRRGIGAPPPRPDDDLPPECKLYVGSIPPNVDEFVLQREFERFGAVVSCRIPFDRETQRPRGFGFVSMADPTAAHAAIAMMDNFQGFDSHRPLVVRQAGTGDAGPRRGLLRGAPGPPYNAVPPPMFGHAPPPPPSYSGPPVAPQPAPQQQTEYERFMSEITG
eukprot:scaffold8.g1571.t1